MPCMRASTFLIVLASFRCPFNEVQFFRLGKAESRASYLYEQVRLGRIDTASRSITFVSIIGAKHLTRA